MQQLSFNQEEFPATIEQINQAEKVWGVSFPQEYKSFLLVQNGGEVYPNIPAITFTVSGNWELWGIDRFCSIGDLMLQKQYPMGYTWHTEHDEEVLKKYNLNIEYLLTFAIAERGCYYLNLAEEQYGQIYFACYQDWAGLVKLETRSFNEFLGSLGPSPYFEFEGFQKSRKIYDKRFFYTPMQPELGLTRFNEVLAYFGDANSKGQDSDWTVIQHYANIDPYDEMGNYILDFLLKQGGKTDGLLLKARTIETILKLVKQYGADINQAYKGRYPLQMYTSKSSWAIAKENYELMDKLLQTDIELDLTVKDSQRRTILDLLSAMVVAYEEYRAYNKNQYKNHPHMYQFLTSELIMKLIEERG